MILLISVCTGIVAACLAELILDRFYTRRMLSRVQLEINQIEMVNRSLKRHNHNDKINDWIEGQQLFNDTVNLHNTPTLSRPILALLAIGSASLAAAAYAFSMYQVLGIAAALIGVFPAFLYFLKQYRVRQHTKIIKRSIPDLLDLIVLCLRGGQSIQATIRSVADELRVVYAALAKELDTVISDLDLGYTIDVAMRRFAERVQIDDLKTLSSMIRESLRLGTDIATALHEDAEMIRKTRENEAEEKAQKAAMKILAPSLLCIFPGTFVVLLGPAVFQMIEAFQGAK